MNVSQALTKLRKTLGPKAAISDRKRPSSPEQREADLATFRKASRLVDPKARVAKLARIAS